MAPGGSERVSETASDTASQTANQTSSQSATPSGSQERVAQFKQEIAEMRLRDPVVARERRWLRLGVVLMVVAAGLEIYAYIYSSNGNALEQNDAQVLALAGLAAAVIGAALFVRYSIAQFLRYWLARLTYEQQTQTDRVVDAVKGSS
jgi:hypothetical protein